LPRTCPPCRKRRQRTSTGVGGEVKLRRLAPVGRLARRVEFTLGLKLALVPPTGGTRIR